MKIGTVIRNMGPASSPALVTACARQAEAAGLDDLWVVDHIAIPPEESSGSEGRYLDPLATLAYLAGVTERVRLGTAVLVLPYRPALPTAKWVATVQELSGNRMVLGVGVGWMEAEFRAVGVPRRRRGAVTDETLAFLNRCFEADEVESNGQRFLFRPRPARPEILVGGAAPHALARAARFADGWMPGRIEPDALRAQVLALRERMAEAGKPPPSVVPLTGLPLDDPPAAIDRAHAFREAGATGIAHFGGYADESEFARSVEVLAGHVQPAMAD